MNGAFDPITLLFLVLAVVIFLRLRNVLGRRTGHERPPQETYRRTEAPAGPAGSNDNVLQMPRNDDGRAMSGSAAREAAEQRVRDFIPDSSPASSGLMQIAQSDPTFDPKQFLDGAKVAYEMIVTAFAEGNRKVLKQFLARDVYDSFSDAITAREKDGLIVDTSFVGINKANVIEADLRNRTAQLTVKFVSQIITAIHDRSGTLIDGDPNQIREVTDIWTFAREMSSRDPNWTLVATSSQN